MPQPARYSQSSFVSPGTLVLCGMVAFTVAAAEAMDLASASDGHEISADMVLRSLAAGLRVVEVPIASTYGPGSRSCSPATSVRYGLYLLRSLVSAPS